MRNGADTTLDEKEKDTDYKPLASFRKNSLRFFQFFSNLLEFCMGGFSEISCSFLNIKCNIIAVSTCN